MRNRQTLPKVALLTALSGIVGCSQVLQPLPDHIKDAPTKGSQEGYLLMGIQSDAYIKKIRIRGSKLLRFKPNNANQQDSYLLAKVPTGKYKFSAIETGLDDYSLSDKKHWGFTIAANTINYIGHLEIKDYPQAFQWFPTQIERVNKASFSLEYLHQNQPSLLEKFPIRYQGPGEDFLFKLVHKQPAHAKE